MDRKLLRLTSSNTFIPLLLLFIFCIAGLYAYSVAIHRDDTLVAAGKEVRNLASAMAMHADQSLRSIDAAMQSLQIEIAQHDYNIEIYSQGLYDKLKGRVTVSPSVLVFILLDAEGNLAYSS